jgi:hypothetical protein
MFIVNFSLSCILLLLVGIEISFNQVLLIILYILIWILDTYTYTNRDSMFTQIYQGTMNGLIAQGDMQEVGFCARYGCSGPLISVYVFCLRQYLFSTIHNDH